MVAIKLGLVALLQLVIQHDGLDTNHVLNAQGLTVLMAVAAEGHAQAAKYLLDAKADIQAVTSGDVLVQTSPSKHVVIESGASPLHFAAHGGQEITVEYILSAIPATARVAAVNSTTSAGSTALHTAAEMGFIPVAESLIKRGAVVHDADSNDRTALILAGKRAHSP